MSKTMSPQQIQANRLNAQKSTGPKTAQGKAAMRLNALKHGILARQVVVQGYKIVESSREFKTLFGEYHEHLAPVGPLEEMLVDQIVATVWRLRRVRIAESGEIALSVDGGWCKRNQSEDLQLEWAKWHAYGDISLNMTNSYQGNSLMEDLLDKVYEAVERDGELTEAVLKDLVCGFGGKHNVITRRLEKFLPDQSENTGSPDAAHKNNKDEILAYLDAKLDCIRQLVAIFGERDHKTEEASQAAQNLPETETLDKIIRYEASLTRQLFHSMNQLERLQRQRLGENVPPPVAVDVEVAPSA
jgi:hypothetical protein